MIIGIDASRANRSHKSGTEWYSYYIIRWLSKLDKKNQYILYSEKPLTDGLLDLTSRQYDINDDNYSEIKYDKNGYQMLKSKYGNFKGRVLKWPFKYFWTQGRMSLEMIIKRPDVLFVPAHALPIIHPKKSIVTIHDIGYEKENCLYEEKEIDSCKKTRRFINFLVGIFTFGKYRANQVDYLKWSTEYALKKASKIISISEFTKKDLLKHYKAKNHKIKVVYNGYNEFLYRKINDADKIDKVLEKYGIEKPYIFYIGRIEKKKNIPWLIESFALMKENNKELKHKLVLVGDASFGYDEAIYMIREFDLTNEVVMPGWVSEEDVPFLYNGASAFVFPSKYEGFGIPLLQAMACGVPVTASNTTSIPEVVGNAALLFNPEYITSISEALSKILTDNDLRKKLVEAGFERVKDFSWEKTASNILKEIMK